MIDSSPRPSPASQPLRNSQSFLERIFSIDLRTLAALRVGFALILLIDLAFRATRLVADYSDGGIIPRELALDYFVSKWVVPLGYLSGSAYAAGALFLLAFASAIALLIGYRTRLATILSWLLLLSIHMRNPYVLQNGDVLLRLSLFWAMFLPWGSLYSIDSLKRDGRGETARVLSLGSAFFLVQAGLVYLLAFITKLYGKEWLDGSAIYYALNIDYYAGALGHALLELGPLLVPLTYSVLIFEGALIFLLFSPILTARVRLFAIGATVLLHLGMGAALNLGPFPWVSVVSILAFLPSSFWDRVTLWLGKHERAGLIIYYDSECGFCRIAARAVPALFFLQNVRVLPAPRERGILEDMMRRNSWISENAESERRYKFDVLLEILRHSPLFFPFVAILKLPPLRYIGTKVYEFIAARRSRTCVPDAKVVSLPFSLHPLPAWANVAAIWFMLLVLCSNVSTLTQSPEAQRVLEYNPVTTFFGLRQRWTMFAPTPHKRDGWYVMRATLADGTEVDIFRRGKAVSLIKPRNIVGEFDGERELGLLARLTMERFAPVRAFYADHLCRAWNSEHSAEKRVERLTMTFMLEVTLPPGETAVIEPLTFFDGACPRR